MHGAKVSLAQLAQGVHPEGEDGAFWSIGRGQKLPAAFPGNAVLLQDGQAAVVPSRGCQLQWSTHWSGGDQQQGACRALMCRASASEPGATLQNHCTGLPGSLVAALHCSLTCLQDKRINDDKIDGDSGD